MITEIRVRFIITLGILCFVGLAVPSAAGAQESFRCANEGQYCYLPATFDHYATSYGSAERAIVIETENLAALPCNAAFGDPHVNVVKSCNTVEIRQPIAETPLSFVACAVEGGVCDLEQVDGEYAVMRYGANGTWVYNNVASNVPCTSQGFGFNYDPVQNVVKTCEVSTTRLKGSPVGNESRWQTCATEGGTCAPRGGFGTYLVKYGADSRWLYRTVVGNAINCNTEAFGSDPAVNTYKHCQYMGLRTISSIQGEWVKMSSCGGCGANTYEFQWGVERGKVREATSNWSQEVKVSVESGMEVLGVGGKGSVETTTTFGESDSIANSFTETSGATFTYACAKGAFWQLKTTVEEFCRPNSPSCSTVAKAKVFQCATNAETPDASWPTGS